MEIMFSGTLRNIEEVYIDGKRVEMPYKGLQVDQDGYYFSKEGFESFMRGLKTHITNKSLTPAEIYEHSDNE